MKKTILSAAILALTAACAMPPEGTGPEAVARYDAAVASVGCVMATEPHYAAVEIQTGMTRDQVIQMGQYRLASGAAEATAEGGLRLISGPCAAA